ncbi:GntR family transcriptional regulator [Jiangella alba]|uniref:DNA-binding transcriptional regulator, GntR family n=1 Tax=Jiangella alba TaxID=561176 RepID=A0A1H5PR18_9ACTN|nr:GntR family transcriptional regulator [Jiangella alba]SEF15678.1 DNA-binding transcriptional regulator, GntR family [Jiangella alba]
MGRTSARNGGTAPADDETLDVIAKSVRGTFMTVEEMTQAFIREAILQGAFPPGHRLNLDAIASHLGVSRMPVRASLRQLEGEGLVRIHTHRGVTVSVLSPSEIAEIYELRILLEGHLIELSIPNLTPEVLDDLKRLAVQLDDTTDLATGLELRKEFYERLYALADRPRTLASAKNLRDSVGRYLLLRRVPERGGHPGLIAHLEAGDVEKAKTWLATHLGRVSVELQALVEQEESETV